jgi:hypothetical protein
MSLLREVGISRNSNMFSSDPYRPLRPPAFAVRPAGRLYSRGNAFLVSLRACALRASRLLAVVILLLSGAPSALGQCTGCGNASFAPAMRATEVPGQAPIAKADFNNDGILDIVLAGPTVVSVYLGDGSGGFRIASSFPLPAAGDSIAVGDFNGDGRADVSVAWPAAFLSLPDPGGLLVFLGDGSGGLSSPTHLSAGFHPASVIAADFNGDGKLDLAAVSYTDRMISVFPGDGVGGFALAVLTTIASPPYQIVAGDIDGDGLPDLAVETTVGVQFLLGTGGGQFRAAAQFSFGGRIALVDFNNDGKLDALFSGSTFSVLLGHGNGEFDPPITFSMGALAIGDFNQDGVSDILLSTGVFLGDGLGSFSLVGSSVIIGQYPLVDDFNGDGLPDVVSIFDGGGYPQLLVSFGNGDGHFASASEFAAQTTPSFVSSADLNADGKPDVLTVDYRGILSAFLGNGAGGFDPPVLTTIPVPVNNIGVGDFDGDGFPDVVIEGSDYLGYFLSLLHGDGSGRFGPPARFPAVAAAGLAIGDFNGDHHLDVSLGNYVFFGDGAGNFGPPRVSATLPGGGSLVTADLNGDGKLDLVLFGGNRIVALLGDGQGGFATSADLPVSFFVSFLVADVNEDGKPDIITGFYKTLSVRLGNGAGGFADPVDFAAPLGASQIVAADFDGDGRVDLAANGWGITILRGDGSGTFHESLSYGSPGALIAAADFTEDGKADLVGYSYGRQSLWLLRNTTCEPRRLQTPTQITSCGTAGIPFAVQPTVRVVDDGGNLVACDAGPVTASIVPGTGPSGAMLGGTTSVAASGGVTNYSNLSIDLPGRGYELRFTHPKAHFATSRPFSQSLPAPTISGPAQMCTVGSSLFDGGAGYDSYFWTLDGVVAGSSRFVTIGPLATGPHALQLIVKQNGCQATGAVSLATQNSSPAPVASNNGPVTFGGTLQLSATAVSGATYAWMGPRGFSSTLQNPMISNATPLSSGRYQVVARVGACASSPATTDAAVLPAPACGDCTKASFAHAARSLLVADDLVAVVLEDFDRDGIADIAIAHGGFTGEISLLRGNGRGGFAPAVVSRLPVGVRSLAAADLNGDGFPDVVGRIFDGVIVALGSPSGTFGLTATYLTHSEVSDVAISDINGDGIPDLVVTNRASNTISVLLGSASGTFGSPVELAVGTSPSAVLVRDLNGDGNPDVVVANQGTNSVSFLFGDGNGGFGAPSSLPVPGSPFALAFGDVTGEGVPDLLVGLKSGSDQLLAILKGHPGGAFTLVRSFPVSLTGPVVVTDVNGDGRSDLLTLGTDGLSVRLGRGGGLFDPPTTFFAGLVGFPGPTPVSFAAGDFNGDGLPDIVVGSGVDPTSGLYPVSSSVALLSGDGQGAFAQLPGFPVGTANTRIGQLTVRDINNDGHPDLLISRGEPSTSRISVYLSDGGGGFLPPTDIRPPQSFYADAFTLGDVDGDGIPDLVLLDNAGGHISVFPGTAAGGFSPPVVSNLGRSFSLRGSGDFNGDKRLDLLISDDYFISSPGISVLLGNSAFGFGSPIAVSGFVQPTALAVADFNHDGRADIVVANAGSKSVSVYLGDGTGRFGLPLTTALDAYPNRVVAGDFDGDENVDIVASTQFEFYNFAPGSGLRLLNGNGAGGFSVSHPFGVAPDAEWLARNPGDLLAGDFNGDGKLDVAAVLPTLGTVELLMGDGLGGFAAPVQYVAGNTIGLLASADLDGDGRTDLVLPDSYPAAIRFLFNTNCIPSRLGVTSSPACPPPGQTFPTQPVVEVFDDGDNVVACDARSVTAAIVPGTGTPGAVLGGATSINAVNGVASFSNLMIDLAGTNYRLEFHHPIALAAGSAPFSVGTLPTPPAASNNGPICVGQTLQLSASSVPGAIYRWTGPNGFTSGLQNPLVSNATLLASGTYGVAVTVNGCTSPSTATEAAVISTPAPTASNNGPICAGKTLQLSASTVAGGTYSWTGPGGFTSTGQNPQILSAPPSASGQYRVTVTANGCTSLPATTTAVIRALPSTTISAPSSICPSSAGISASVPSAGTGATYSWTIGNGTITSGAGTRTIVFTAEPSGSVQLDVTVTNANACSASGSRSIPITGGPQCGSGFFAVAPCRVADTRYGEGPSGGPALVAGTVRSFPVANVCGIPSSAKAVAINLAVFTPSNHGDLRVYPDGEPAPLASSINFRPGIVRANNAIIALGVSGQISVQCDMVSGGTDFFFDVYGYFQ